MDPQQEIFTAILMALRRSPYGDRVYDGQLPPEGTPYPFIYLADTQVIDEPNKGGVFGRVIQTIHVYSNDTSQRGTTSRFALAVKNICRQIEATPNFTCEATNISQHILNDNTTDKPLLHVVLDVEYRFS